MSASLRLEDPQIDRERQGTAAFVLSLRGRGICDRNVLRALETVPREAFAPRRFGDLSRADVALPIACGQTMTAPSAIAAMLAALEPRPGDRVLEIGTGTGYVAALLARIGCEIVSIERQEVLADTALARIAGAGFADSVGVFCGDGLLGGPESGRFDRILLNGTVGRIGPALTSHLVAGGRLVGGTVAEAGPRLLTIARDGDGRLVQTVGARIRLPRLVESAAH